MQQLWVLPHFFQQQASFLIVYLNRQVVSKQEPGRVTIFDFENVSKRYYYSRYISMIINHKRDGRASTWTLSSQLPRMIRRQRRVSRDRSIDGTNMEGGRERRVFDSKRSREGASMPLARSFYRFFPDGNEDYSSSQKDKTPWNISKPHPSFACNASNGESTWKSFDC